MSKYQNVLLGLLADHQIQFSPKKNFPRWAPLVRRALEELAAIDLAQTYVDVGYLQAVLKFLVEQHWLQEKREPKAPVNFNAFLLQYLESELAPRSYLFEFLKESSLSHFKGLSEKAAGIEVVALDLIQHKTSREQKLFATEVLEQISDLFDLENRLQSAENRHGEDNGFSLYRTYDGLDRIFHLDYLADQGMKADLRMTERLYEGAGVGVQSGYSTVLMALRHLAPAQGSRFIDLGSGYGRLGMAVGLLRPDIDFKGYEFVQHRVNVAMAGVQHMELQSHVGFYQQDLSEEDFKIPDADIYYLYDPFSAETYRHVLNQLMEVGQRQPIAIATKGNARGWLLEITQKHGWPPPREFHGGNLCLFSSD